MNNLFSVFDIAPSFDLDLNDLEKRYFTVQRTTHPDRFIGKPPAERQQAILRSMQANEAYEALKNPLQRARHLLALQNIQVGSERDSVKPSHELLMDIMELREMLEDTSTCEQVEKLKTDNDESIQLHIADLSAAFRKPDYALAAQLAIKLGYLVKIEEEIRLKGKSLTPLSAGA